MTLFSSCGDNVGKQPPKTNLFVTTNAGSLYAFDITQDKLLWEKTVHDTKLDELTYFSFYKDEVVKSFLNAKIAGFDRHSGKLKWTYQDTVSEDQRYYDYDLSDVRFVHFYQNPTIYQDAMIFANSHGEIKSIDIPTQKENWNYQTGVPLFSAPQILGTHVFANIGYRLVKLDAGSGKELARYDLVEGSQFAVKVAEHRLYMLTEAGSVICLDENLEPIWTFHTQETDLHLKQNLLINGSQILIGSNKLLSIDLVSGQLNWKLDLEQPHVLHNPQVPTREENAQTEIGAIVAMEDGYAFNTQTHIVTVDHKGSILHKYKWFDSEALLSMTYQDGCYYIVTRSGKLYKLDRDFKNHKMLKQNVNFVFGDGLEDIYFGFY